MDDFLQKLKKVVRVVLYGPAISQSNCKKAGPYQLLYSNLKYEYFSGKADFNTEETFGHSQFFRKLIRINKSFSF